MICQNCHTPAAEGAPYCANCGDPLSATCARCGHSVDPGSRYCTRCGAEAPAASEQQRTPPDLREATLHRAGPACPQCNARNDPSAEFCATCGVSLRRLETALPAAGVGRAGGFWARLLAYVLDSIGLTALNLVLAGLILGLPAGSAAETPGAPAEAAAEAEKSPTEEVAISWDLMRRSWVLLLLSPAYFTLAIGLYGTTIGKHLLGLRVVRFGGGRVGLARAFFRWLVFNAPVYVLAVLFASGLDSLSSLLTLTYAATVAAMIGMRPDKRAPHDLACGTQVVYRQRPPLE